MVTIFPESRHIKEMDDAYQSIDITPEIQVTVQLIGGITLWCLEFYYPGILLPGILLPTFGYRGMYWAIYQIEFC